MSLAHLFGSIPRFRAGCARRFRRRRVRASACLWHLGVATLFTRGAPTLHAQRCLGIDYLMGHVATAREAIPGWRPGDGWVYTSRTRHEGEGPFISCSFILCSMFLTTGARALGDGCTLWPQAPEQHDELGAAVSDADFSLCAGGFSTSVRVRMGGASIASPWSSCDLMLRLWLHRAGLGRGDGGSSGEAVWCIRTCLGRGYQGGTLLPVPPSASLRRHLEVV